MLRVKFIVRSGYLQGTKKMMTSRRVAAASMVLFLSCLTAPSGAAVPSQYTIRDLGTFGGETFYARGINDLGQIVGLTNSTSLLWQSGAFTSLGKMPGGEVPSANDINDSGLIIGSYYTGHQRAAWRTTTGVWTAFPTYGGSTSIAVAVNDTGQVAGWAYDSSERGKAFVWTQSGGMTQLGTLGGTESFSEGMNSSGQIVGHSRTASGAMRPFIWQDGAIREISTTATYAEDINDSGWIVVRNNTNQLFLTNEQVTNSLSLLQAPVAINNAGQVVGVSEYPVRGLLAQDGTTYKLADLLPAGHGWTLTAVYDINESGQIVGYGTNSSGQTRSFLMTPVPEPAMLSLLALGGAVLIRRRK